MRWVKEIFPPRVRRSWLFMTMRLSASSFAGTARTLVAVGTVSDAFMFLTTADAAPRSGVDSPPLPAGAGFAAREVVPAAGLAGGADGAADRAGAGVAAVFSPFLLAAEGAGAAATAAGAAGAAESVGAAPLVAAPSRTGCGR